MRQNAMLKVLGLIAVFVFILVVSWGRQSAKEAALEKPESNNLGQQSGDTINESLHVFAAKNQKLMDELSEVKKALTETKKENQSVQKELSTLKNNEQGSNSSPLVQELSQRLQAMDSELSRLKSVTPSKNKDYFLAEAQGNTATDAAKPIRLANIQDSALYQEETVTKEEHWSRKKSSSRPVFQEHSKKPESIPFYTLPAGSDLGNVTLLQALIGEVPSEEKLKQPLFPFSVMVSRGALMSANGISLPPDIMGMKFSGYSVGVGSFLDGISCVRSYVTAALFVFQDGHFVTVGAEQMNVSANLLGNDGDKTLGYLTTPYGNPCMPGTYHTNAPRVLAALGVSGGIGGIGKAYSEWQTTAFAGPAGVGYAPTGSLGTQMAGQFASESTAQASDWMKKRISGSFDMVFIPASIPVKCGKRTCYRPNKVALHLTKTIDIDKAINGRRILNGNYQNYHADNSLK